VITPASLNGHLPVTILEVEWEDPTLVIRGEGWHFNTTCAWRVVQNNRISFAWSTRDVADRLWDLISHELTEVRTDPTIGDVTLVLSDGLRLDVFADTEVDPWVLSGIGDVVLVGPIGDL
jgi:hypothetical protein